MTADVTPWTKAAFLNQVGKRTPVLARFSTVAGEQGYADTDRDPRGFALKFYTEEGNYDLVGNNTPVFFVRDPTKFQDFIHSQKRMPDTGLRNDNMQWDFWSLSPESLHQVAILMSDRGTPRTWRHMNGYSSHTFMWMFSYHDTHLHRIGTNYEQLPVNRPRSEVHTYNKDGAMRYAHGGNQPVYAPNSYGGPQADPIRYADPGWFVEAGEIVRSASELHAEDDDFIQAGNLYRDVMSATDRDHLVSNIVGHMADGVERQVQERAVALWRQVDPDVGERIAHGLGLVTRAGAPAEANALR